MTARFGGLYNIFETIVSKYFGEILRPSFISFNFGVLGDNIFFNGGFLSLFLGIVSKIESVLALLFTFVSYFSRPLDTSFN